MKRTKQSGSISVGVFAGVVCLILFGIYCAKGNPLLQTTMQAQENEQRVDAMRAANNLFSRMKALMGEVKTASGVFIPAIFALNYYEGHWKLGSFKNIDPVKVDDSDTLTVHEFRLSTLKTNFDEAGTLAESIDVEVVGGDLEKTVRGRIPLRPPAPYDIKLQVRQGGTWSDDLAQLQAGKNEFRVVASGIAFDGRASVNGILINEFGGFDANGKIRHKAYNYLAKNEEIGRFSFTFPRSDDSARLPEPCAVYPLDGIYSIEVEVNGPDRSEQSRLRLLSKVLLKKDKEKKREREKENR